MKISTFWQHPPRTFVLFNLFQYQDTDCPAKRQLKQFIYHLKNTNSACYYKVQSAAEGKISSVSSLWES